MISRNRSAPTAAAMSIECTTSANNTVTCLYSAAAPAAPSGVPHLLQNRDSGGSSAPHDPHNSSAGVTASRPSPVPPTSGLGPSPQDAVEQSAAEGEFSWI